MKLDRLKSLAGTLLGRFSRRKFLLLLLAIGVVAMLVVPVPIRVIIICVIAAVILLIGIIGAILVSLLRDVLWVRLTRNTFLRRLPGFNSDDWAYGRRVILFYSAPAVFVLLFFLLVTQTQREASQTRSTFLDWAELQMPGLSEPIIIPRSTLHPIPPIQITSETHTPETSEFAMSTMLIADVILTESERTRLSEITVTLVNYGEATNLLGWRLEDGLGNTYTFADFTLGARSIVALHSSQGDDSASDLYWNRNVSLRGVLHKQVVLRDPSGQIIDVFDY